MSKVIGPAISLSAKGKFGKKLTFQKRPSGATVYPYSKPGARVKKGAIPSEAQKTQRTAIGSLVAQWKALSPVEKSQWDIWAKAVNYIGTGYHYFIHLTGVPPVVVAYYLLLEIGDKILLEDGYKIKLE